MTLHHKSLQEKEQLRQTTKENLENDIGYLDPAFATKLYEKINSKDPSDLVADYQVEVRNASPQFPNKF